MAAAAIGRATIVPAPEYSDAARPTSTKLPRAQWVQAKA